MTSEEPRATVRMTRWYLVGAAMFVIGVAQRWHYGFLKHDPRDHVYSDMLLYVGLATRSAEPRFTPGSLDVVVPPAGAWVLSRLYSLDHSLLLAARFQFVISCLLPLAVLALGWVSFGKKTGIVAMCIASVYFPFIDYGGYFLTEIPFALLVTSTVAGFLWATRRKRPWAVLAAALASGIVLSLAVSYKLVALPAVLCLAAAFGLFFHGPTRRMKALAVAGLLAGSIPLIAVMTDRCTRANEGRFCLVASHGPADMLLGHYGRINAIRWTEKGGTTLFGSPPTRQHGYSGSAVVPFSVTDGAANSAEAWSWIRNHPGQAFVLSIEHVYDLFCGSFPWPSAAGDYWPEAEAWHFGFMAFLLLPCLLLIFDTIKTTGLRKYLGSMDFLLLSPVLGLVASVMVATGEARYRIPFDAIFIVVGVEFYRRYIPRFTSAKTAAT